MHATAETSRKSYEELVSGNHLPAKQKAVVAAIYLYGPMTRDQIASKTGMRLSGVCGRCKELLDADIIEGHATVKSAETGKSQQQLRLVPKQLSLI